MQRCSGSICRFRKTFAIGFSSENEFKSDGAHDGDEVNGARGASGKCSSIILMWDVNTCEHTTNFNNVIIFSSVKYAIEKSVFRWGELSLSGEYSLKRMVFRVKIFLICSRFFLQLWTSSCRGPSNSARRTGAEDGRGHRCGAGGDRGC